MTELTANSWNVTKDFPFINHPENKDLIYFDSAATSQKPGSVIDAISTYYQFGVANVHRGVHRLSDRSTQLWEQSCQQVAQFLGADANELIITRNATEALNGVAYGWGEQHVVAGDVLLVSGLEHHANLVPWQELAKRKNAVLKIIEVDQNGQIDITKVEQMLKDLPVKLIAVGHVSNVLGSVLPIKEIATLIKKYNHKNARLTRLAVDGAQAVPHIAVSFKELGADFYAFSGHKLYGPMGIGGLLVKKELLESNEMLPWLFGGGMIDWVTSESAAFANNPNDRFTAGTPDVASAIGLAAATKYLSDLGMARVADHEQELVHAAYQLLSKNPEISVIGPNPDTYQRIGSVAFTHTYAHAHDIAQVFNSFGIAVRSGHHCAMPLHIQFNWQATTRISFGVYNTSAQVSRLQIAIDKINTMFR